MQSRPNVIALYLFFFQMSLLTLYNIVLSFPFPFVFFTKQTADLVFYYKRTTRSTFNLDFKINAEQRAFVAAKCCKLEMTCFRQNFRIQKWTFNIFSFIVTFLCQRFTYPTFLCLTEEFLKQKLTSIQTCKKNTFFTTLYAYKFNVFLWSL